MWRPLFGSVARFRLIQLCIDCWRRWLYRVALVRLTRAMTSRLSQSAGAARHSRRHRPKGQRPRRYRWPRMAALLSIHPGSATGPDPHCWESLSGYPELSQAPAVPAGSWWPRASNIRRSRSVWYSANVRIDPVSAGHKPWRGMRPAVATTEESVLRPGSRCDAQRRNRRRADLPRGLELRVTTGAGPVSRRLPPTSDPCTMQDVWSGGRWSIFDGMHVNLGMLGMSGWEGSWKGMGYGRGMGGVAGDVRQQFQEGVDIYEPLLSL